MSQIRRVTIKLLLITDRISILQLMNCACLLGIIILGEIGATFETEVADWLSENKSILQRKPIVGYIAGIVTPPNRMMGHAGAMWEQGLGDDALTKINQWKRVGIRVVENTAQTAVAMEEVGPNLFPITAHK